MSNPSPFPCLRRLKMTYYNEGAAGIIVLFTAPTVGIVINDDDATDKSSRPVGYRSHTLIRFDSEEDWEPVDCNTTQVISSTPLLDFDN